MNKRDSSALERIADREEVASGSGDLAKREKDQFEQDRNEIERLRHNLGVLGKLFGDRRTAPTNIAGLTVVVGLLAVASLIFFPPSDPSLGQDIREVFGGVVLSALGYLFGAHSRD